MDIILSNMSSGLRVLALTETRLDDNLEPVHQLPGFKMYTVNRKTWRICSLIYTDNCYSSKVHQVSLPEPFLECLGVEMRIGDKFYLSICVYRPPSGNVTSFIEKILEILSFASKGKYKGIYMMGDFNLDVLKHIESSDVKEFINCRQSFSLFCLTTKPTRVTNTTASIIDQIWTTEIDSNMNKFIVHSDITDHFPVMSQFKQNIRDHFTNIPRYIHERIICNGSINSFNNDFQLIDWSNVICLNSPNKSYNLFHTTFNNLFHDHFPTQNFLICKKKGGKSIYYKGP